MKNEKTNWSSPKKNIFAGINDLRKALASGCNAILIKEDNEKCMYPIRVKKLQDFRLYKHQYGTMSTRRQIMDDKHMSDFQKYLTLNYVNKYAANKEAIEHYYNNGTLTYDNLGNIGRSHLVKVTDLIDLMRFAGKDDIADRYYDQYICPNGMDKKHFFDFFSTSHDNIWAIQKFKRKLWVVELHDEKVKLNIPTHQKVLIKILNTVLHPLKYIPRKSTLKMPEYTNYNFRIGGVTNGFSVEFQIPKKFSFK